jgi:predicted O-methyltransferase YrrM
MDITSPDIEKYLFSLCPHVPEYVLKMEEEARKRDFPIVDRIVGQLLSVLASLKKPELVVELGSGFGYSAYWFARAMEGGRIVLTDREKGNIESAKATFELAGLADMAEFHVGEAMEAAKNYREIDILFVDHDKAEYKDSVETLLPNLAPGAMIIADNTLWQGKVLTERDEDTLGILAFNEFMFSHEGFNTTLLPIRDGVLVAVRKG